MSCHGAKITTCIETRHYAQFPPVPWILLFQIITFLVLYMFSEIFCKKKKTTDYFSSSFGSINIKIILLLLQWASNNFIAIVKLKYC